MAGCYAALLVATLPHEAATAESHDQQLLSCWVHAEPSTARREDITAWMYTLVHVTVQIMLLGAAIGSLCTATSG